MAATMFIPRASPSCSGGKASVMIAAEFAIERTRPPIAWNIRKMTSSNAPVGPVLQTADKKDRPEREPGEAQVVHLHTPEDVADAAHPVHDHGGRDQHVAHHDPEQEGEVYEACNRSRSMLPRKMTGKAMMRLVALSVSEENADGRV